MKHWLWLLSLIAALALASPGDDRVLAAREAYRNGEHIRLGRLADAMAAKDSHHDLQPWVEYWRLQQRLDDGDSEGVIDFLARERGSYLAERLRSEWLKLLGKRRQWTEFQREYPSVAQPDQELACYELQRRRTADPAVLDEARPLWFAVLDLPESCVTLMEQLIGAASIDADDIWTRLRRLLEAKKLKVAAQTAAYLPPSQSPAGKLLASIAAKPSRFLDRQPRNFAATRLGREMAMFAVQRMAHSDPAGAGARWRKIQDQFSTADRGYVWGQLAWQGAQQHLPQALEWYALAGNTVLTDEQLAWLVRAALRAHDWPTVMRGIERMSPKLAAQPDWTYWFARALAMHNRHDEARTLYQKIAGQPNFYSNLADEELNRLVSMPPRAAPPTSAELAAARDNPGLRRALALLGLGLRNEGLREWSWTLRGMDDRQLLAAADLALRNELFDRAINAADRTQTQHDYALRYLAPFRDRVEPLATELAVDSGWVYGLMRQESRFMTNAHSGAGAKGLMQLMPRTAQWVAKKIGLKSYHPSRVSDLGTNLTLGTHYLRLVLASLDHHPLLASAAYNAGPGRARRWRADAPLEGAVYAETIPFSETRDYVKKVMSNAMYYSALFEDRPQSLKSRLGAVGPRSTRDQRVEDLP